ncbi:hypothetical protein KJ616_02580 [Patescibacteria group bacterium]|nr:hypothetical protein [Patescibacteria group bacterium]
MNVIKVDEKNDVDSTFLDKIKNKGFDCILTTSVGIDHIDTEYAKKIRIRVENTDYQSEHSVAQHYFALLLKLCEPSKKKRGIELRGKQLAILGYGRIGKACEQIAKGFGMDVVTMDFEAHIGIPPEFITKSFALFLCMPLTGYTRAGSCFDNHGFFGKRIFENIFYKRHDANKLEFVVNCARDKLVDNEFMAQLLDDGKLRAYAVDEETIKYQYITKSVLDKLYCTPHIGWKTRECANRRERAVFCKYRELLGDTTWKKIKN